ncbi:biotin transporter BioY [Profundibacterium mesophilum]|uniref:Biotin transporter n=1 Tax=Profundibacterium mesophilum KAUST100406-0324 TaxID=1037889 RepID=A0A921NQ07_9RHOB|nr:biotin transporter BioY [Profundibacterium mesophilum]KAF0675922.1 Biotin synthesis BioY protein [Profundibacterium mesophilum KAUST100406-0324]
MERNLAYVALFAALIAVLGLIPKITLMSGVPITAQSLGIMLCGTVLGARRGALAVLLFLGLVALGLPLLAGGRGGIGVFFTPSVGYLIGWPIAAYATGWITERFGAGKPLALTAGIASVIGGIVVLYVPGIIGMAAMLDKTLPQASLLALPFIPGDLVKAVLAGLVTAALARARPGAVLSRS